MDGFLVFNTRSTSVFAHLFNSQSFSLSLCVSISASLALRSGFVITVAIVFFTVTCRDTVSDG